MLKIRKNNILTLFSILLFAFLYIIYLFIYADVKIDMTFNLEKVKLILSWVGILLYGISIYSWYKKTGHLLDLYTIFLSLMYVMNYGQCLLWAFGIHSDTEIGRAQLFSRIFLTDRDIVVAQLITLMGCFGFHMGALLINKKDKEYKKQYNNDKNSLYQFSKLLSFFVIPCTFIKIVVDLVISIKYGYSALYITEHGYNNYFLILISRLFFPCLFGLLLGSNFRPNVRKFVYIIFACFVLISLKSGERGTWFYQLLIFVYLHNLYVNKLNAKKILRLFFVFLGLLYVTNAVSVVRNTLGISFQTIIDSFDLSKNPIITSVFELGGTMNVQAIVAKYGFYIYPYGNSYLFAFLGMISDKFIYLLGFNYVNLSTWFSDVFLALKNWGIGYSIIAEAFTNFGPFIGPFFLMLEGFVLANVFYIDKNKKDNYMQVMFSLITFLTLAQIIRGTLGYFLKVFLFTVLTFFLLYKLFLIRGGEKS